MSGNKYYLSGCPDGGGSNSYRIDDNDTIYCTDSNGTIFTGKTTGEATLRLRLSNSTTWNNKTFTPQIYDLTAMFGSGNEPTLEECKSFFSGINAEYTTGKLWNATTESVVSYPYNLWDEKWEIGGIKDGSPITGTGKIRSKNYIPVEPNTTYAGIWTNGLNIYMYTANKSYIGIIEQAKNSNFTTPSECKYIKFTTFGTSTNSYSNNIAIVRGESGVYRKHNYDETTLLIPDALKNLPDWGCAVSDTVYNWIDFENGVYHHKVGSVDLGDLDYITWNGGKDGAKLFVNQNSEITGKKAGISNIICAPYNTANVNYGAIDSGYIVSRSETSSAGYIYIRDDTKSSNTTDFKNGLKGQKLLYELATEELIDISDMLHPIRVEAGGTITFQNEHNLDMPNTITYKKEVSLI